jgi:hypothetical protein
MGKLKAATEKKDEQQNLLNAVVPKLDRNGQTNQSHHGTESRFFYTDDMNHGDFHTLASSRVGGRSESLAVKGDIKSSTLPFDISQMISSPQKSRPSKSASSSEGGR